MSAHKRALIKPDSAALRRLDELSAQLRATTRPDPALLSAARKETRGALKRAATQTHQRQEVLSSHLDLHLAGLDARLVDLAHATEVALSGQSQQLQSLAVQSASQGHLASQVESLIDQQAEQLYTLLDQTHAAYQSTTTELAAQLSHVHRRSRTARQAAVQALHLSQSLLEGLEQAYPAHPSFAGFQSALAQAQANLEQGLSEAALSTSQQVSWQLQELRVALECDLAERNLLRAAALEKAAGVHALLVANQEVSAVDLEGRSLDYPLNVDFWTAGGWTHLVQSLTPIQEYLSQSPEALSIAELQELLRHTLPQMEQSVPDLVAGARRAVLASQLRFNMAEAVVTALGEQGFVPAEASYLEGDMRQAYQLALHNLEGSQLVVTLQPRPEGMQNQLDLLSQDHTRRTPHELRQRASELARALRRVGLQVLIPAAPTLREAPAAYNAVMPPTRDMNTHTQRHQKLPATRSQ